MKNIVKLTILSVCAAGLVALPALSRAQTTTNAPAMAVGTNAPMSSAKKHGTPPIKGKIAKIDASAGTFTVGETALTVTSTSKISTTNNVPATLADFKLGDMVVASYKKAADGTLNVTTLHMVPAKKKKAAVE